MDFFDGIMMKKEKELFFTALMFYTRIPCPKNKDYNPNYLNQATRYFPLVGWIVGVICFLCYELALFFWTSEVALIFSMIAGVLTTGAFHEDGFADVCDGFGGGWTKEKIVTIMKDSVIGAYGAIGLVLLLLLKFEALYALEKQVPAPKISCLIFVAAHALSRLAAISIVFTHRYSGEDAYSKSKPIANDFTWREVLGACFFGLLPLFFLCFFDWKMGFVLAPVFLARYFLARYFQKWIDGYTGDCLGATQQVCEVIFYLFIVGLWKFI